MPTATSRTSLGRIVLVKPLLLASGLLWAGSASAHEGLAWHVHPEEWAAVALLSAPLALALVGRLFKAWRGRQASRPSSQGRP